MAKIIEDPKEIKAKRLRELANKWVVGRSFRCYCCSCLWEVEASDSFQSGSDEEHIGIYCPVCGRTNDADVRSIQPGEASDG